MTGEDWTPEVPSPLENVGGIMRLGPDLRPRLHYGGSEGNRFWCLAVSKIEGGRVVRTLVGRMHSKGVGPSLADGAEWASGQLDRLGL